MAYIRSGTGGGSSGKSPIIISSLIGSSGVLIISDNRVSMFGIDITMNVEDYKTLSIGSISITSYEGNQRLTVYDQNGATLYNTALSTSDVSVDISNATTIRIYGYSSRYAGAGLGQVLSMSNIVIS